MKCKQACLAAKTDFTKIFTIIFVKGFRSKISFCVNPILGVFHGLRRSLFLIQLSSLTFDVHLHAFCFLHESFSYDSSIKAIVKAIDFLGLHRSSSMINLHTKRVLGLAVIMRHCFRFLNS